MINLFLDELFLFSICAAIATQGTIFIYLKIFVEFHF
jgi:hypothetical protein